jgi:hypothetical protein
LPDPERRTPLSLGSLRSAQHDENERHDDRIETIAIAISLVLLISGLVAILATLLLSRSLLRASDLLLNQMLNDRKVAAPLFDYLWTLVSFCQNR